MAHLAHCANIKRVWGVLTIGQLNIKMMRVVIYITRVVHEMLIRGLMGRYLWTYLQWAGLARMQVHSLLHM